MDDFGVIEEMSRGELLDFVGALGVEQRRAEALVLVAAVQHAVLHNEDTLDPVEAGLPGRRGSRSSPRRSSARGWACRRTAAGR